MRKLINLLLLSTLSAFAIEYSLEKDQFISHVLLNNNHLEFKWDLKKIAEVLKHNGLTWESAKRLPVGYTFEVPESTRMAANAPEETQTPSGEALGNQYLSANMDQLDSNPTTRLKLGVNAGVFQEELGVIAGSKKFIYSNMSQQLGINFESDKEKSTYYTASLNFQNHVYAKDSKFGINENIEKVTHSFKLGYSYRRYHNWKVTGFAENESKVFFNIQGDGSSELVSGNSTNLGMNAEWSPMYIAASLWGVGMNYSGKVLSNEIDQNNEYGIYLFTELYEAGLRADLGYSFTDFEVNSDAVRNRQVELNLNYSFL